MSASGRFLGWLLGLPPVRAPSVGVQRDLAIPARDGVVLLADRYFPVANARAPVVLIRTPYGRGSANVLVSRLIAERGYQVVIQSLRGTGGSGGTFNGFTMNRDDGPATIDWMRGRDWFPGAFATWGASYLGYAQWDLASQPIPEWKAAIIDVGPSDFYHTFMYPGGVFALGNALGWAQLVSSVFSPDQSIRTRTVSARTAKARLARAANQLPVSGADRVAAGERIGYFQEWIRHERYDDYWAAIDYRSNASNMPSVVHLAGGWWDFLLPNVLADYAALSRPGRSVRLFISSAAHGRNMALRSYQRDAFAMLDRAFGNQRPSEADLTVRVRVTGTRRWADLPGWPPAIGRPAPWYLQPAGRLDTGPAPSSAPSRYVYDPASPRRRSPGQPACTPERPDRIVREFEPSTSSCGRQPTASAATTASGYRSPAAPTRASTATRGQASRWPQP